MQSPWWMISEAQWGQLRPPWGCWGPSFVLNTGTVNGRVGKGWAAPVVSWFSPASFFLSGQLEIRSALDMSNKAGGKRPTTTNSDLTNHSMVSEVPPERPSVRVSLADPWKCIRLLAYSCRFQKAGDGMHAVGSRKGRGLRPEPYGRPTSGPGVSASAPLALGLGRSLPCGAALSL